MKTISLRMALCLAACLAGGQSLALASSEGAAGASGRPGRPDERAEATNHYPAGEKLTYRVKFIVRVGSCVMKVLGEDEQDGRKVARLRMTVRSGLLASMIAKVDDVAESTVDLATGGSLHCRVDKKEGKRRTFEEFTVDMSAAKVIRSYTRNHKGEETRKTSRYTEPVQDILSFFYHLRAAEFHLGQYTDVTVFQGHRTYPLRLAADGLERLRLRRIGTFWAYCIHPSAAVPGLFSAEGDATLWLEDATQTLLKMAVRTPGGTVVMYLVKAENSPLTAAPGARRRK